MCLWALQVVTINQSINQLLNQNTCQVLVVVAGWRNMAVVSVEPRDCWCRVSVSATEQHGVRTLEAQHHRRPHNDVSCSLSASCAPVVRTNDEINVLVQIRNKKPSCRNLHCNLQDFHVTVENSYARMNRSANNANSSICYFLNFV